MSIDDRLLEFELVPGITYKLLKQALYKDMVAIFGTTLEEEANRQLAEEVSTKLREYFGQ